MVFNPLTFALFFAVILGLSQSGLSWRGRKWVLLIGSYLFYAAWNRPFVALLWPSTIVDWHVAKCMHAATDLGRRRLLLMISLGVNLGMLNFFKYGNVTLDNFV